MTRLGRTPPFRTPSGEIRPGSIAEIAYLRIGGLDQCVTIRGESVSETREFPTLDHYGIERTAPQDVARAVTDFFVKTT